MEVRRRLTVYYALLTIVTAGVVVAILVAGRDEHSQPAVAGGYDVTGPGLACLGPKFDVLQSGEFVTLDNAKGTVGGRLRFKAPHLRGDVTCLGGRGTRHLEADLADGELHGTLGAARLNAELKRDPPPAGQLKPVAPDSIAGDYLLSPRSPCLGGKVSLEGSGDDVHVTSRNKPVGTLAYTDGVLAGTVLCRRGSAALAGTATGRTIDVVLGEPGRVTPGGPPPPGSEHVTAIKTRDFTNGVAAFFLAVVVVMLFARLLGNVMPRLRQPRVMGEVLAGILLGPTVLGAISPDAEAALFPADVIPYIGVAANLGLIFYMFLVGLELDLSQLRGRVGQTFAISNTGVAIPMMAGLAIALPIYTLVGPPKSFTAFALFMGVSMSITAFPVLARIIAERRMLKRPLGALALAAAAVDDVTAWFLIALATAVAVAGGASGDVLATIGEAVAFVLVMAFVARPLLRRASVAFDEAGRVPGTWIVAIFAGILVCAYTTEQIGIALIFGAFAMGVIMPRNAGLSEDVTGRMEDLTTILLLPLFFAFTGLKTDVGLLDRGELIWIMLALIGVAIACKFGGTVLAARVTGMGWRESAVLGTLMNTRGLTELIVLNLALDKGVLSPALFAALVMMALVTTFMAGPVLRLLDPKNSYGAPVEEELEEAGVPETERSILVAPQSDAVVGQLVALATPLARTEPPRELILARVLAPPRTAGVRGALQTQSRRLTDTSLALANRRASLVDAGVASRSVAFTSDHGGDDLARLAEAESVDLVLIDGRRPLLGGGVPRGDVGLVLRKAPSDVAVLVARDDVVVSINDAAPVVVPFGGAEHDWAALELGAWLASANGAPLRLLGAASAGQGEDDASRLLGNASLLVQQFAGIAAEPVMAEAGEQGVIAAAGDAGVLVLGLSERWRTEGLGTTRAGIVRAAPAPILFVSRGLRPGALAPKDDVTRFTWSSAAIGR